MLDDGEIDAVVGVLRSGNFDLGRSVAAFKEQAALLLAKGHGVMVKSGTSALWLAVDLLGCEPGDEVITSPLTFSSDIAPLVRNGIIPAFVNVDAEHPADRPDSNRGDDHAQDEGDPRAQPRRQLPDWDTIRAIADAHDLIVVEDSCDVLDARLHGTRTGERAHISVGSFARGHSIGRSRQRWAHRRGQPRLVRRHARPQVGSTQ